jgi:hypothetical protein
MKYFFILLLFLIFSTSILSVNSDIKELNYHAELDSVQLIGLNYNQNELPRIGVDSVVDGELSSVGWNRYAYVKGNPVVYKDPTGHNYDWAAALEIAEKFLGNDYFQVGASKQGIFRNKDGRQFRINDNSLLGKHSPDKAHIHLEVIKDGSKKPSVNNHIIIEE